MVSLGTLTVTKTNRPRTGEWRLCVVQFAQHIRTLPGTFTEKREYCLAAAKGRFGWQSTAREIRPSG